MGIVRNLMVRAGADFSPLTNAMSQTERQMRTFRGSVTSSLEGMTQTINRARSGLFGAIEGIGARFGPEGLIIGAAVAAVGETIKSATESAMQLDASMQQVNFILQNSSNSFQNWAQSVASSFGYSQQAAEGAGAVYSNIISGFTQSTEETKQQTENLMKATAIISARTGRSMDDVIERIRSGLLGNTEAIEDLGVYANISMIQTTEAFKKLANGKSWNQLNYQTRQQILLMGILEQATKKYGNSLPDNMVTRVNKLHAAWSNLVANFGNVFIPILYRIVPAITKVINTIATGIGYVASFMKGLFGMKDTAATDAQTSSINKQTGAANNLSNAINKVGSAKKQASKVGGVAGFDQVHTLNDNSSSGDTSGSGGAGGLGGTSGMFGDIGASADSTSSKIANLRKKFEEAGQAIGKVFTGLKDIVTGHFDKGIHEVANGFADLIQLITGKDLHKGLNDIASGLNDIVHGNFRKGLSEIGKGFEEIIAAIFGKNGQQINKGLNEIYKGLGDIVHGNFRQGLGEIGQGFQEIWNAMTKIFSPVKDWFSEHVAKPISTTLQDWKGNITSKAQDIWDGIKDKFHDTKSWFSEHLGKEPYNAFANWKSNVANKASDTWSSIKTKFADTKRWFSDHLGKEPYNALVNWKGNISDKAGDVWSSIKSRFGNPYAWWRDNVVSKLYNCLDNWRGPIAGKASDVWSSIKGRFGGAYNWFRDNVAKPIRSALSGINDGLGSAIESGFKSVYNKAADYINKVIKAFNKVKNHIPFGLGRYIPSVPTIPHLAKGGITNGPMMAVIGDNPGGQEVVTPLDKLGGIITNSMIQVMQMNKGNNNNNVGGDIVLNVDGRTFARIIKPWMDLEDKRVGTNVRLQSI